jgi:hypothetical protein
MEKVKTIKVSDEMLANLAEAVKSSLAFEKLSGKQLNITSTVGEVLACREFGLSLVVNDINQYFDAIDSEGKKVQIKTRRGKLVPSTLTGPLLDRHFTVNYDYAVLVLLEHDYSIQSFHRIDSSTIKAHFDRINGIRETNGKPKRKTMAISQFKKNGKSMK